MHDGSLNNCLSRENWNDKKVYPLDFLRLHHAFSAI